MLEIGVLPPNRTLTGAAEDAEHDPRPLLHRVMSADPSEGESAVVGAELSIQSTISQQQQFDHIVRPGESIQAVIERAAPGERLLLDAGEHTEGFTLRRDILIMGRHEPSTSESESSAAVPSSSTVLRLGTDGRVLLEAGHVQGLLILRGEPSRDPSPANVAVAAAGADPSGWFLVELRGREPTLEWCEVAGGVRVLGGAKPTVRRCVVRDSAGSGVLVVPLMSPPAAIQSVTCATILGSSGWALA